MTTMVETPMMPPPGETREIQTREAINEALAQEMRRDETVIIMGEEIAGGAGREHLGIVDAWGGAFRTTRGLIQEFGNERVLDTPLSEAAFVGTAIGGHGDGRSNGQQHHEHQRDDNSSHSLPSLKYEGTAQL